MSIYSEGRGPTDSGSNNSHSKALSKFSFHTDYKSLFQILGYLLKFEFMHYLNPIPHNIRKSLPHIGGAPVVPPPRISGTLTHRMTKLSGNTHLGINSLYRAFNSLKINTYCLKMPDFGLKGPSKVFKLKTKIFKER